MSPGKRIAFFTIGESPRSDVVPAMAALLGAQVQVDEYGALDALDAAARARLAPRPGAHCFATRLRDGGSITLISGILSAEPIRNGANATEVNAAIEGFVADAAIELPRGLRINAVSPTVLTESLEGYGPFFPGFESVPAARVALAYQRSVEGAQTGRVYRVQ